MKVAGVVLWGAVFIGWIILGKLSAYISDAELAWAIRAMLTATLASILLLAIPNLRRPS